MAHLVFITGDNQHSDIGGGYTEGDLPHVSLMWMIDQAEKAGVKFDRNLINQRQYNQVNNPVVHDSVGGANGIPELSWLALGLVPTGMYFTPGRQVLWGETEGKTHGVAQRDKDKLAYLKLVWDQTLQFENKLGGEKFDKAKEFEEYYIKTNMLQCRSISPIRCNPLQAYYDLKSAGLLSTGKSGEENNQVILYNDSSKNKDEALQIQSYLSWINSNYQMGSNSLSTKVKP
jgi:hypothetical protein